MLRKVFLYIFSAAILFYSIFSLSKILRTVAPDFIVYFAAAQNLLHNQSLYTTHAFTIFNYPPISAFFFLPFVGLPYQLAQGVFVGVNYIAIFLCVVLCFKILDKKITLLSFLLASSLFLLSFPTKFTLGMGQSNLIAYALLLGAIWLSQRNRSILAGLLLAVGIIFKPILVLSILYFICNKQWKLLCTCIMSGLTYVLLEQLFFTSTFSQWVYYLTHVLPDLMTTKGRDVYYNQGLLGTISRFTTNFQTRQLFDWIGVLIILTDVVKNVWLLKQQEMRLALLLCTLPLIDSLSWQHHFIVLLFPFLVSYYALRHKISGLVLLGVIYILISANIKNPQIFIHFPLSIVLSHVFWGTLMLLGVLLYIAKRSERQKGSILQ